MKNGWGRRKSSRKKHNESPGHEEHDGVGDEKGPTEEKRAHNQGRLCYDTTIRGKKRVRIRVNHVQGTAAGKKKWAVSHHTEGVLLEKK